MEWKEKSTEKSKSSPEPEFVLRGHTAGVNTLSFHPKEKDLLVSGSADNELRMWRLSRRRTEHQIKDAHKSSNGGILWTRLSDDALYSQGRDGIIKIWKIESDKLMESQSMACDALSFCKCDMLLSESILALPKDESEGVEIWDTKALKMIQQIKHDTSFSSKLGMCLALKLYKRQQSSELLLLMSYESGDIHAWNISQNKLLTKLKLHSEPDVDKTGEKAIAGSSGTTSAVFTIDYEQSKCELVKEYSVNHGGFNAVTIRGDNKICATAGWDHRVRIYNWKKLNPLALLKNHTDSVNAVEFSMHSNWLASAGKDKRILIWSLY